MRIRIVLLSFFLLFFSGCGAKEPPVPLCSFSAFANISIKDSLENRNEFQANISSTAAGVMTITLTSPPEVAGLCYKWEQGFEMIYKNLHLRTERGYLPRFSFAQVMYDILIDVEKNAVCEEFDGERAVFKGKRGQEDYTLVTDSKGYIQSLCVEKLKLKIEFSY